MADPVDDQSSGPVCYLLVRDRNYVGAANVASVFYESGQYPGDAAPADTNGGRLVPLQSGRIGSDLLTIEDFGYEVVRGGAWDGQAGYVWSHPAISESLSFAQDQIPDFVSSYGLSGMGGNKNIGATFSSAFNRVIAGAVTASNTLSFLYRSLDDVPTLAWTSSSVNIINTNVVLYNSGAVMEMALAMCETTGGALLAFAYQSLTADDGLGADVTQKDVCAFRSEDGGVTWTLYGQRLSQQTGETGNWDTTNSIGGQMLAASSGEYVRVIVTNAGGNAYPTSIPTFTLVSSDRGASWAIAGAPGDIASWHSSSPAVGTYPLAMVGLSDPQSTFLLASITTSDRTAIRLSYATADGDWTTLETIAVTGNGWGAAPTVKGLAFARSERKVWLFVAAESGARNGILCYEFDIGMFGEAGWWRSLDDVHPMRGAMATMPGHFQAVWAAGEMWLLGCPLNPTTTSSRNPYTGGVALALRSGGWSSRPLARSQDETIAISPVGNETERAAYGGWWPAFGSPTADGLSPWTSASSGSPTVTTTPSGMTVSVTGTDYQYWEWADTSGPVAADAWGAKLGHVFVMSVKGTNWRGDPTTSGNLGMRIRTKDVSTNVKEVDVSLRIGATSVVVYDHTLGAAITTLQGPTSFSAQDTEFRLVLCTDYNYRPEPSGRLVFRARSAALSVAWSESALFTLMHGSSGRTIQSMQFGIFGGASGTAAAEIYGAWVSRRSSLSQDGYRLTYPTDLRGAPMGDGAHHIYRGMMLRWAGSGGIGGDTYAGHVQATSGVPALSSPSPRMTLRTPTNVEEQMVYLNADPDGIGHRWQVNAVGVVGNAPTWLIGLHTSVSTSAVLTGIASAVFASSTIAAYSGWMVKLNAPSGPTPRWGEYAGKYIQLSSLNRYQIQSGPDEDGWVQLYPDGVNAAPTGAATAAAYSLYGSTAVWRSDTDYRYQYLSIYAQQEIEGSMPDAMRLAIGAIVPGQWVPLGRAPDWTKGDIQVPNNTRIATRSGTSWTRKEGPAARTYSLTLRGDTTDQLRTQLRNLIREHQDFDVHPVILAVGTQDPRDLVYGTIRSTSDNAHVGYLLDTASKWRPVGDTALIVTEEV